MNARKKGVVLVTVLTALGICLILLFSSTKSTISIPSSITELLSKGEYREAEMEYERRVGDSYTFSLLCSAFEKSAEGKAKEAHSYLNRWENLQKRDKKIVYSEELLSFIADFREKVDADYKATLAAEYAQASKNAEIRRQQYEENLKNNPPYVGLSESDIGRTSLGAPTRSEFIDSKFGDGVLGFYYWDRGGKVLFVARTANGSVRSVTDMGTVRSPAKRTEKTDPYNAKDYSNAEDFYDENWNDFMDYYEAEDYWEDHQ